MFDKLKKTADDLKGKVSDAVDKHGGAISDNIDKAATFADSKTGGKYTDKIVRASGKVKNGLDNLDGQKDDMPPSSTSTTTGPTTTTPPTTTPPTSTFPPPGSPPAP